MQGKKTTTLRKTLLIALIATPILAVTLWSNGSGADAKPHDTYKSLEVFSNVLSLIQKNYVENVDATEVLQGAIRGMLTSLDPHSSYLKPDDFRELKLETKGSFTGIGIEITIRDSALTVVSPIEDTPGDRAGLKAGDKIVRIEGELTKDMSLMEAVKKLRGPKGTTVNISVYRDGWTNLREHAIVRDVIPLLSVRHKVLEPGYAYIRITNFQSKTSADFKKALDEISEKGRISGLIIDLRNNPGGLLAQSVKVADFFVDEGIIVSTKGRIKEQNTVYEARSGWTKYDFPIVVLVNEGSASASEIVAGALQDHKKALVVGTKTFGKGSVQTIIPMSNGAGLRLTTARYYTPSGRSIQAKGIEPDILVEKITPTEKDDDKSISPTILREIDLRHHIDNGDKQDGKEEKSKDKEAVIEKNDKEKSIKDKADEEAREIVEQLYKDNQLRTALMLLKGLNVYSGFKPAAQ
ncbi:MAG: S41 family peptidase [Desulfurivibrionaceae bacterium]|nr:S41 family peptidase [Desulfobulbales bacterium]MDT8335131.1 S41 family peptidase [Desulfurivibrionaceae bacterium]